MSLRLKTILGVALIEAALLALLLTLTLNYLRNTNFDGLDQRAFSTSNLFASTVKNAVLSYDLATVESFTQELLNNQDIVYVAVLGDGGQMLSGSGNLPEAYTASLLEDSSSNVVDGIFDVSSPISESGIAFGSVWIGFDMTTLNTAIQSAKKWSLFIVLGEMALVALFSYMLGAYLTLRLSELKRAADAIAAGERDIEVNAHGSDELATVSRAFNNMLTQIKDSEGRAQRYQDELQHTNAVLETRVMKRTQALTDANHQLIEANQQLKNTQDKLVESEKLASIGTIAAGVSHEINNPLGAIRSNIQLCQNYLSTYQDWIERSEALREGAGHDDTLRFNQWKQEQFVDCLQDDFRDSLQDALQSVDRVRNIVAALQHCALKIHQEKGEREPVELKRLLSQCLATLNPPNYLVIELTPSLGALDMLYVNSEDFQHLFTELLKNAIQACQRKPNPSEGCIRISAQTDQQQLIIDIIDNGIGIEESHLKRLYDPFFTSSPVGDGMGLGLTFAYHIVRNYEGTTRIRNREAGGIEITLTFPLTSIQQPIGQTTT